jgi:hypothetical protein
MDQDRDGHPLEEPLAELERRLIDDYLTGAGHDPAALRARGDAMARSLLTDAATYAASRLSEVEARSHYLRALRGSE